MALIKHAKCCMEITVIIKKVPMSVSRHQMPYGNYCYNQNKFRSAFYDTKWHTENVVTIKTISDQHFMTTNVVLIT